MVSGGREKDEMCNLMRHACIPIFAWRIQHIEVYSSDSDDGLLGCFAETFI